MMVLSWNKSNQETLESRIIRHEGFCAFPKVDIPPMYVIGFGHDITKTECENYSNGITWNEAEELLEYDLNIIKQNCAKEFPWLLGLDDIRQSVIWEMCYQLGVGGVSQFKNMIAAIREKNWEEAANSMLESQWQQETPVRCQELASLMRTGETIT